MHDTILVTGAGGFAGTHLLTYLTQASAAAGDRGLSIEAWCRPGRKTVGATPRVGWRNVDVLDQLMVDAAIRACRPSAVYHLAGAANVGASWQQSSEQLRTHVLGTHHVLQSVKAHVPNCRVLVVSSGMIYRPQAGLVDEDSPLGPVSPYGLSKLAEDRLAQHAAVHNAQDVVIARPFNHIGPGQTPDFAASSFARQIAEIELGLREPVITVGNLESARDLTDVRDVVAAYVALMRDGQTATAYNICSGLAIRMHDVLDQLRALSTTEVTIALDPSRLRPSDVPHLAGSSRRIAAATGWHARTPLIDTLRDLLVYWRTALAPAH